MVSRIVAELRVSLAIMLLFFSGFALHSVRAQIAFTNLDFEDGVFVPVPGSDGYVKWDAAMPGWKGYIDESIEVDKFPVHWDGSGPLGLWSTPLNPGSYGHGTNLVYMGPHEGSVSIAQTAMLPSHANLVTFYIPANGQTPSFNFGFWLTFNGQQIWLQHLATIPAWSGVLQPDDFRIWGGDISRFAGQTGTLMFTLGRNSVLFDNIRFYPTNAPHTSLKITATATNTILLEWADAYPGAHTVEQTSELYVGAWITVPDIPIIRNPKTYVTLPPPTRSTFYRLKSRNGL